MSSSSDALEAAYEALHGTVRDIHGRGGRAYAALLRPGLERRFGQFDERMLGFTTFRGFLKDAESRGHIRLHQLPGGHIEALPPEAPESKRAPVIQLSGHAQPTRLIRRDLWRCFVDRTPDWRRIYDRQRRQAFMFPVAEAASDRRDHVELRNLWKSEPTRFCEIDAIASDIQRDWIGQFAESVDNPVARDILLAAAAADEPFEELSQTLLAAPAIAPHWHLFRVAKVAEQIEQWMARNALLLDYWETPAPTLHVTSDVPRVSSEVPSAKADEAGMSEAAIRARVHELVDRLPFAEILNLRLLLSSTLTDRA